MSDTRIDFDLIEQRIDEARAAFEQRIDDARAGFEKRIDEARVSFEKRIRALIEAIPRNNQGDRKGGVEQPAKPPAKSPDQRPPPGGWWGGAVLVTADTVQKRYGGRSKMWLHRRLTRNDGFPRPRLIGRIRYWAVADLEAWEESLPAPVLQGWRGGKAAP